MANIISRIFNKSSDLPKQLNRATIAKVSMMQMRQDAQTRKDAIQEASDAYRPYRVKMQRLYLNTAENGHIHACIERRKDLTMLRKWKFTDLNGKENEKIGEMFNGKQWFESVISNSLDALFYGYSLIWLGNITNNEFVDTEIEKRWNVNPDAKLITPYEYGYYGVDFINDKQYCNSYIYVDTPHNQGVSKCGFGLFYILSTYEILCRNVLGLNGDYVEVNVVPIRQIKTTKTEEAERNELYEAGISIASNGLILTDHTDDLILHQNNNGTGYIAFDNFEKRLESQISKLILGHADAITSIPGKLGNDSEQSPASIALRDKQTKDGRFIENVVNQQLLPKMRALGFAIPEGITAELMNDNEDVDIANNITDLAVKMKQAGLQMDANYFTGKTNIPISSVEAPKQVKQPDSITNKLKEIYG